jgi:predicted DsbA family dithiol-disulfide isomerase
LPLAACLWAGEQGALRSFKHALYEAFFCEGHDIATDHEIARAASRVELDPDRALAAAYAAERLEQIRAIRRDAEAAGVAGVPTLLLADGRTHWGTGGVERLLAGEPLVPRA